jgi:hypothetical protein
MADQPRVPADLPADSSRMLVRHRDVTARASLVLGAVLEIESAAPGRQIYRDAHRGVLTISTALTVPDDAIAYSGSAAAPANP